MLMKYFKYDNYINIKKNDKKDRKLFYVCFIFVNVMLEFFVWMFRSFMFIGICK